MFSRGPGLYMLAAQPFFVLGTAYLMEDSAVFGGEFSEDDSLITRGRMKRVLFVQTLPFHVRMSCVQSDETLTVPAQGFLSIADCLNRVSFEQVHLPCPEDGKLSCRRFVAALGASTAKGLSPAQPKSLVDACLLLRWLRRFAAVCRGRQRVCNMRTIAVGDSGWEVGLQACCATLPLSFSSFMAMRSMACYQLSS